MFPAVSEHTVKNSICKIKKNKMAEIQKYLKLKKKWWKFKMVDIVQDYTKKMFGCPLYIHNTKKACSVRLRGCPNALYIWMLPYVLMPPVCLMPHMFGCPSCLDGSLYLWMPSICLPVCLDTPYIWCLLCLDASCMLGHPHMFGCSLYIHNTKKACFVRLGVSIGTHTFGCPLYTNNTNKACFVRLGVPICPHTFGCPLYV